MDQEDLIVERSINQALQFLSQTSFRLEIGWAREALAHGQYRLALRIVIETMTVYDVRPTAEQWDLIREAASSLRMPEPGDDEMRVRLDWLQENVSDFG